MREDFLNCNISTHIFKKKKPIGCISWCRFVLVQCCSGCWPTLMGAVVVVIVW